MLAWWGQMIGLAGKKVVTSYILAMVRILVHKKEEKQ